MIDEILTFDEAKKYLKVHKATLYRWAQAKKIPAFKAGRSWRFKKEKIDAILYGHTHVIRNEMAHNILFFNPGSAFASWPAPWKTHGILNVGEQIFGEIVSVSGRGIAGFSKYTDAIVKRNTIIKWVCGSPRFPDYSIDSQV